MVRVFTALGHYWYEQANFSRALECHEAVLRLDRLHEPAYQQQMRIYIQEGRHAEAAAAYKRCKRELSTALGVMPSEQSLSIYSMIKREAD